MLIIVVIGGDKGDQYQHLPCSIIFLTGGGLSFKMYAVVGNTTPTVELVPIISIPLSLISSR
jgi:hypothetical protein